ncbi:MAG: flagellar motor switch protein FliN [Selenomonadaceae bacterium]|nr:flagellar motor switch protein FliN [Selenomonadaceae bacterium]
MFKLKLKDGATVSTIEELRENFDLEKVVDCFHSGELLQWLKERFYDDEAEAIENIDDDTNLIAKICTALNVECEEDLEFTQRLREKKALLAEMTDDENFIDNAASTALNQEDLAALIQTGCKTIYLCGEKFNVPICMAGVKYIGVLSTPKIKIRAKSQDDLDAQKIVFENCILPWQKYIPVQIDEKNIGLISNMPLQVTVELGRTKKTIQEILDLATGSILELNRLSDEPFDIQVNNHLLAKGEVVIIDKNFGVRITEIVAPVKRVARVSDNYSKE